jgi:hypothetical protein
MSMLYPDIQSLLRLIRHNEQAKSFDLSLWFYVDHDDIVRGECGTTGCLVGNDVMGCCSLDTVSMESIENQLSDTLMRGLGSKLKPWSTATGEYGYGVPHRIFAWLFHSVAVRSNGQYDFHRDELDRDAAIARVRKYVYYVLHKREMMTGGTKTYDNARQTGHVNVAAKIERQLVHA